MFLSFPPRAPHTLSRAPKFPLPLPLSTPATQAMRRLTDTFLEFFFFCNFWLLLFGFSDSLLFGWREAKTGNTSAFAGYPTAVTRQNRLRSRLPNWRMLNKTTEGVSDLLEDNSMCWRTSISRGTQQLFSVKYLLGEANISSNGLLLEDN